MADSFTPAFGLRLPALNDPSWNTLLNDNFSMIAGAGAIGPLAVAFTEVPSTNLNVKVAAGSWRKADGLINSYAGSSSFALTASSTNSVYLTDAGTLTKSTSGFPTAGNFVPLAVVLAGSSTITSITDARLVFYGSGGHIGFGVGTPTIAAGTGAGTSPTIAISGSDQAGLVSLTTGTSPSVSATVATVTFGMAFTSTARMVSVRPANAAAAALSGTGSVWADSAGLSTTAFTMSVGSTALAASTVYKWWFEVLG